MAIQLKLITKFRVLKLTERDVMIREYFPPCHALIKTHLLQSESTLSLEVDIIFTRCQFHQCFLHAFFVRMSFRQLFFTYTRTYIHVRTYVEKKAAKTTFVQKKRAENVDEIDTRGLKLKTIHGPH